MTRPAVLTVPEVARLLGASTWTVYAAVRAGDGLPVPVLRVGRKILFPTAAVATALGITVNELFTLVEDAGAAG